VGLCLAEGYVDRDECCVNWNGVTLLVELFNIMKLFLLKIHWNMQKAVSYVMYTNVE